MASITRSFSRPGPSSSKLTNVLLSSESRARRASTTTRQPPPKPLWPSKTHLRKSPSIPAPVPAKYAQMVQLADGSTFIAYTTAPTPSIIRLTRDVTNNPLWAPGTEKRGLGEGSEEGRVGRFRRRFEGVSTAEDSAGESNVLQGTGMEGNATQGSVERTAAFAESDFDWMSEGAKDETVSSKEKQEKPKAAGKKK